MEVTSTGDRGSAEDTVEALCQPFQGGVLETIAVRCTAYGEAPVSPRGLEVSKDRAFGDNAKDVDVDGTQFLPSSLTSTCSESVRYASTSRTTSAEWMVAFPFLDGLLLSVTTARTDEQHRQDSWLSELDVPPSVSCRGPASEEVSLVARGMLCDPYDLDDTRPSQETGLAPPARVRDDDTACVLDLLEIVTFPHRTDATHKHDDASHRVPITTSMPAEVSCRPTFGGVSGQQEPPLPLPQLAMTLPKRHPVIIPKLALPMQSTPPLSRFRPLSSAISSPGSSTALSVLSSVIDDMSLPLSDERHVPLRS